MYNKFTLALPEAQGKKSSELTDQDYGPVNDPLAQPNGRNTGRARPRVWLACGLEGIVPGPGEPSPLMGTRVAISYLACTEVDGGRSPSAKWGRIAKFMRRAIEAAGADRWHEAENAARDAQVIFWFAHSARIEVAPDDSLTALGRTAFRELARNERSKLATVRRFARRAQEIALRHGVKEGHIRRAQLSCPVTIQTMRRFGCLR